MAFCDFVVKFDPDKDSNEDITKRILYSIIIKPIKRKKPRIIFIGGDSGEGKSTSFVRLQQLLCEIQGLDFKKYIEVMNCFTPLEYPQKMQKILFDKEYKKINIIGMHEARDAIRAKMWHSFLNQAIGDVNAQSRAIKRMAIFIISQFIKDISSDIRYTLNYYCKVSRPLDKKARLYINVIWKDDRDLEKPKLRKRKLQGYLVDPDGNYTRFIPKYLELTKPDKEIMDYWEKLDRDAKEGLVKNKLDKLISEMEKDLGHKDNKIENIVKFYVDNPDSLATIGQRRGKYWRLSKNGKVMHDFTPSESKQFEKLIVQKLGENKNEND